MTKSKSGVTIVELLIAIVVIGILAAFTVAVYSNMQQQARDSIRKGDLATISKALKLYSIDNNWIEAGSGYGIPTSKRQRH